MMRESEGVHDPEVVMLRLCRVVQQQPSVLVPIVIGRDKLWAEAGKEAMLALAAHCIYVVNKKTRLVHHTQIVSCIYYRKISTNLGSLAFGKINITQILNHRPHIQQ